MRIWLFFMTNDRFLILLQGPEVGDVNPLLIQPSSETLAGKNNNFCKSYINLQSSTISMTFSNKPSVQSTELQDLVCRLFTTTTLSVSLITEVCLVTLKQQKSAFFEYLIKQKTTLNINPRLDRIATQYSQVQPIHRPCSAL